MEALRLYRTGLAQCRPNALLRHRPKLRARLHAQSPLQRRGASTKQNLESEKRKPASTPEEVQIPIPNTVPPVPEPAPRQWWHRLGPITRAAGAYGRAQRRRPYVTQLCTSLAIYFCADLSAQSMDDEYDPKRTVRSLVIGAVSSIPSYKWFMFLSHNFNYSSKLLSLATKIAINQTFFTPVFNTYFFGMQSFLSGGSLSDVLDRIRRAVPTSIVNSLKLWPAVTAFSFTFIAPEYRSAFAGVIAVGWQTYLAYLNRQAEMAAAETAAAVEAALPGAAARMAQGAAMATGAEQEGR
ncbi:hypothetical protein PspLS_11994 [Pyricularia sp. CBS 133598]|nr:hypothetical protein PspLS_11994 [Pyricularia sp. CBS 133598]